MTDSYEEHAVDMKNEAEAEEELNEDGLTLEAVDSTHFKGD